jgi:hypothetical protein
LHHFLISLFQKFRSSESLPDPTFVYQPLPKDQKIRVFFSYQNFPDFLTDDHFEVVDTIEDTDIVWIAQSFKDYK